MKSHARIGDPTKGTCKECLGHPSRDGQITTGSGYAFAEDLGLARLGDEVTATCGHKGYIDTCSGMTLIQGIQAAREDDHFDGDYEGTIVQGSTKVFTE